MNKKVKTDVASLSRKDTANVAATRNTLVSLYNNFFEELKSKERFHVEWLAKRDVNAKFYPLPEEEQNVPGVAWYEKPSIALTPNTSFASVGKDSVSDHVIIVAAFGRKNNEISELYSQSTSMGSRSSSAAIFFVDEPYPESLIKAGITFEVFPKEILGALDQSKAFRTHFEYLWRKWNGSRLINLSKASFLEKRLEELDQYISPLVIPAKFKQAIRYETQPIAPPSDVHELRAKYHLKGLESIRESFVLFRILGNDLPPRHRSGQTLENLDFILANEPDLEDCEKLWIINRIIDPTEEKRIIEKLDEHGQTYHLIPFDLNEYGSTTDWDIESFPGPNFFLNGIFHKLDSFAKDRAENFSRRHKNRYVINNNGARNKALDVGRKRAKWILPWDGNCYLTQDAWSEIRNEIVKNPYFKYFTVPMARVTENRNLLLDGFQPPAAEEPQLVFRFDASESFDPKIHYGRRPKVELLYRLGVRGPWSNWFDDVWDATRPELSIDAGSVSSAGWVARLNSGVEALEKTNSLRARGLARIHSINTLLDGLDERYRRRNFNRSSLLFYDIDAIRKLSDALVGSPQSAVLKQLEIEADLALQRGPYSVIHKTELPPSGIPQDYFNPAPYWWPNPKTKNGLPYIRRDGERLPGTIMYGSMSERYDRTRLQRMCNDVTVLALAWLATGNKQYVEHSAYLLRVWFLNEDTRMTPHLKFSQPRSSKLGDEGSKSGLIEMKDLYFLLDAVRICEQSDAFTKDDTQAFTSWVRDYKDWFMSSKQGVGERVSKNNHGTCYDLQLFAIAAYLDDVPLMNTILRTSRERILAHFTETGEQPHELDRTQTAHYCAFNLQSWVNLADAAAQVGDGLWEFAGSDGRGIQKALVWFFDAMAGGDWPYKQLEPFDKRRLIPLLYAAKARCCQDTSVNHKLFSLNDCLFHPHDGIKPFWMLGYNQSNKLQSPHTNALSLAIRKVEFATLDNEHSQSKICSDRLETVEIDRIARSGFKDLAVRKLYELLDDPARDRNTKSKVARVLARNAEREKSFSEAISLCKKNTSQAAASIKERILLEAHCFAALGSIDNARNELEVAQEKFPTDVDVFLASLNMNKNLFNSDALSLKYINSLNRLFQMHGMAKVELTGAANEKVFSKSEYHSPSALQNGQNPAYVADSTPLVTVFLTSEGGCKQLARTVASLQEQTLGNIQIVLLLSSDETGEVPDVTPICSDVSVLQIDGDINKFMGKALNEALTIARGEFICIARSGEIWHPQKLEIETRSLVIQSKVCRVPKTVELNPQGHFHGSWSPRFGYSFDDDVSAIIRKDAIKDLAGWDDSISDPRPLLMYRLTNALGTDCVIREKNCAPVIFRFTDSPQKTVESFPFGKARDEFRQLRHTFSMREENSCEDYTDVDTASLKKNTNAALTKCASTTFQKGLHVYDQVLVGDFTRNALMIDRVVRFVKNEVDQSNRTVGLFNWPREDTAVENLAHGILDLVCSREIHQISAYEETLECDVVTICSPYCVWSEIDGRPDFRTSKLEVVRGTPLSASEKVNVRHRPIPDPNHFERIFGVTVHWRSLD